MKDCCLDVVLVWSRAIKISVDFYECWAFAAVAVVEPLAGRPYVVHSWHVSVGTKNFFVLFSLGDFFQDCFHKNTFQNFGLICIPNLPLLKVCCSH
jgi:hypothetical protein